MHGMPASQHVAAPPRFEHGLLAPQAGVISKLHYRALVFESTHLSDISPTGAVSDEGSWVRCQNPDHGGDRQAARGFPDGRHGQHHVLSKNL